MSQHLMEIEISYDGSTGRLSVGQEERRISANAKRNVRGMVAMYGCVSIRRSGSKLIVLATALQATRIVEGLLLLERGVMPPPCPVEC